MSSIKVAVVMGSKSDEQVMAAVGEMLGNFGIESDMLVLSAHRQPNSVARFARNAEKNGYKVIIAGAGKAAALPGVIASHTRLPVIGVPIKTDDLGGLDSLLSIVQMPKGIPVACVAINGAVNAALLAVEILSLSDPELNKRLIEYRAGFDDAKDF
ncbi:MAG: 5-(carboxyamino)imidazole ribonucleotide mutase [Actinobacteria bacterium]|nr:5-(carboxyamino)imidazole ribonucleotide mutase [Actinomycetota bacterium]